MTHTGLGSFKALIQSCREIWFFFQTGALASSGRRTVLRRKFFPPGRKTTGFCSLLSPCKDWECHGYFRQDFGSCGSSNLNWTSPTSTMLEMGTSELPLSSAMTEGATLSGPKSRTLVSSALLCWTNTSYRPRFKPTKSTVERRQTLSQGSKETRLPITAAD